MRVRQQPVAVADGRNAAILGRAGVDGDELADDILIADDRARHGAIVFFVLRNIADRREWKQAVIAADRGLPGDKNVRPDRRAFPHAHARADDRIGADFDSGAKARAGGDNGRGMNAGHHRP